MHRFNWNQMDEKKNLNKPVHGKYNLISVWFNAIQKRHPCVYPTLRTNHPTLSEFPGHAMPHLTNQTTKYIYIAQNKIYIAQTFYLCKHFHRINSYPLPNSYHTQRNLFEIVINQTQINRYMVNAIWFRFDLTRYRNDFSVCNRYEQM